MKRTHMLLIDCQNDFCSPDGSLFVQGADQDMKRLSNLIGKIGDKISEFHVSLDSHNPVQIFFSSFWKDRMGNPPPSYTKITAEDVAKGVWETVNPQDQLKALNYVQRLEANGKELIVWPKHTIKGTLGHALFPDISNALINWSETTMREVNFCYKGDNKFTEMYSIFKAEVPDPTDQNTMLNGVLITRIIAADEILIAGEALSHCVKASVEDLISVVPQLANRFVLLEDCCSNVGGFETYGNEFIDKIIKRGVRVMKSTDYCAKSL